MNAMQCNECPCTPISSITAPQALVTSRANVLQYWWTQVCRGDLEADPPGPAFYNRPTIAADIFTTPPPTKLYLSLFLQATASTYIPARVLP